MNWKIILLSIVSCILYATSSYAIVELGGNFSYDKSYVGTDRQSTIVSRAYSGTWVWYLFKYTALELGYTKSEEIITDNRDVAYTGTTVTVRSCQRTVQNDIYQVGIRQALAPRKSFLMPLISIGYAKVFQKSKTEYVVDDGTNETIETFHDQRQRSDSVFAAFVLQIRLTRSLKLNGSVKTFFKAFEYNEAKYNLKYAAGLSWIF